MEAENEIDMLFLPLKKVSTVELLSAHFHWDRNLKTVQMNENYSKV